MQACNKIASLQGGNTHALLPVEVLRMGSPEALRVLHAPLVEALILGLAVDPGLALRQSVRIRSHACAQEVVETTQNYIRACFLTFATWRGNRCTWG